MECNSIINEQTDRLTKTISNSHLLQLLANQNELTNHLAKLDKTSTSNEAELKEIIEQYKMAHEQRIILQKAINKNLIELKDTLQKEYGFLSLKTTKQNLSKTENDILQQLKLSSTKCISLVCKYNEFMEVNKKNIDGITAYFKTEWRKFESNWYKWTNNDIIIWFKYRTKSMNTQSIEWNKIKDEFIKQNISGKSLDNFTENSLYMVGMHDFEI
eukprot:14649_1